MVFLWFSYGFPMVFLWFSHEIPMNQVARLARPSRAQVCLVDPKVSRGDVALSEDVRKNGLRCVLSIIWVLFKVIFYFPNRKSTIWGIYSEDFLFYL